MTPLQEAAYARPIDEPGGLSMDANACWDDPARELSGMLTIVRGVPDAVEDLYAQPHWHLMVCDIGNLPMRGSWSRPKLYQAHALAQEVLVGVGVPDRTRLQMSADLVMLHFIRPLSPSEIHRLPGR